MPENAKNKYSNLRKKTGMTQQQFAEYFGVSKRTVENWDSGKIYDWVGELVEYKLINEGLIASPNVKIYTAKDSEIVVIKKSDKKLIRNKYKAVLQPRNIN